MFHPQRPIATRNHVTQTATLTITGDGALAFTGLRAAPASLTVAGNGAAAFTGLRAVPITVTITGNGTFAFTATISGRTPIRRRYRPDTDARDLHTTRPTAPRGRNNAWWN